MAAGIGRCGGSSPHEVLCVYWFVARNPVKPGGDCRCGDIWSLVIRPMAAGTDNPGGSSPSELCIGVHNFKV